MSDARRARMAAFGTLASLGARDAYYGAKRMLVGNQARSAKKYKYSRSVGARRNVGRTPGEGNAHRTLVVNVANKLLSTRTLNSHDLTWISRGSSTNQINQRQRELINCKGFKLNFSFRGPQDTVSQRPAIFHYAVITEKGNTQAAHVNQNDAVSTDNFFRGNGSNRAINFQDSLSGMEMNCLNINNDIYTVLKRGSVKCMSWTTSFGAQPGAFKNWEVYVPMNRQIRYDDGEVGEAPSDGRTHLVYWTELAAGTSAGATAILSATAVDIHAVTYWHESCGC